MGIWARIEQLTDSPDMKHVPCERWHAELDVNVKEAEGTKYG